MGQGNTLVKAVERVASGIKTEGEKELASGAVFDDNLDIMQALTKSSRQFVENAANLICDVVVIQRGSLCITWQTGASRGSPGLRVGRTVELLNSIVL